GTIAAIPSGHPPRVVARIPAGCAQRPSLGGLARSPDGTLFVARLGWGEAGAVVRIRDDVTIFDDTDPKLWHLGGAYDERNGVLWATAFERPAFRGWLLAIDPQSGRVVDKIGGFRKPVGVIVAAGSVWVADQRAGCMYQITNSTIAPVCEELSQPDS